MQTEYFLPDERPDHEGRGAQIPDGTLRVEVAPDATFGELKAVLEAIAVTDVRIWKFAIEPCEATRDRRLRVYGIKEWDNVCSMLPEGPFWSLGVVAGPDSAPRYGVVDYDKREGHRAPAVLAASPGELLQLLGEAAGELASQPRVTRVATEQQLADEPGIPAAVVLRAMADFEPERSDWTLELLAPLE